MPPPIARVTEMMRATGLLSLLAITSPVSSASSAASPAAAAIARSKADRRVLSAPPRPRPVNRRRTSPMDRPDTVMAARNCGRVL
jgi:hypothetical protein